MTGSPPFGEVQQREIFSFFAMETGDKDDGGNEGGVFGKTVKVSIRDRLQAFRCSKSTTSAVPKPSISRIAPKIQHVKCGEREDNALKGETEDISKDDSEVVLSAPAETFNSPLEIISVNECHSKSISESSEERNLVGPTEPPLAGNLSESNGDAVSQENIIRPINREVVHQICSGQVCFLTYFKQRKFKDDDNDNGDGLHEYT